VVWENFRLTGETDLEGAVYDGATRLASANLSALENVARGEDQVNAAVDADGCRFVVAYAESFQGSATDYDVYASTFHYDAGAIGLTERHVILDYASTREDRPAIAAANSLLLRRPRYLAVWDSAVGAANHDVKGAVLDAHAPTGGHASVPTGCGGLTLTATGVPALGIWLNYRIAGSTGFPYLFIGSPMPSLPLCPSCALGVFPGDAILLPGLGSFDVQVPCVPGLIGQSLAFQGASIGMAGGCPAPLTLALTNTIVTTVQ
jgi:hypothetical protein